MKTYLYIKTHNQTGLKYFGKTNKKDIETYRGSGTYWLRHINKYGYDVTTEILGEYELYSSDLVDDAINFSINNNIVESKEWANLEIENGLNGRGPKYSEDFILDICEHYKNRKDIEEHYPGILHAAKTYNILDKITSHMVHSSRLWDESTILEAATQCSTKSEFTSLFPGAADAARALGIWGTVTSHMKSVRKPKYDLQVALEEAKKYNSKTEYISKSKMCHWVRASGYWGEATSHMVNPAKGRKLKTSSPLD